MASAAGGSRGCTDPLAAMKAETNLNTDRPVTELHPLRELTPSWGAGQCFPRESDLQGRSQAEVNAEPRAGSKRGPVLGQELTSHGSEQIPSFKFSGKISDLVKIGSKVLFCTLKNHVRDHLWLVLATQVYSFPPQFAGNRSCVLADRKGGVS